MRYFNDCKTIDEAKNLFRKLCLELHPDKGGKATDFIEMHKQFKAFKPTIETKNDVNFDADEFYNLIQKFENFEGIILNFVGSFIWIEGNTRDCKDELKQIKLDGYKPIFWAKVKKAWFFSPLEYKKKSGKVSSLEEIKSRYGCKTFATKQKLRLT
jgi:hypothetical protein